MDIKSTIKLNNGVEMPVLGLGTWESSPMDVGNAILWALEAGYRHIDTAAIYGNEKEIGEAIKKSGVNRKDIFITTKLWNSDHDNPIRAYNESLKRLQVDYVDLYLMHWPVEKIRNNTWKYMEKLYKQGKCKAIGVSNFTIRHLKELFQHTKIMPAVNQVEFSPYLFQKELLEFCNEKEIALEAYSPLTRAKKLNDPKLAAIAKKYSKTPAQILIRWVLQHNMIVIPKSINKERIKENANVFDFNIEEYDMKKLDLFNENFRVCWNPDEIL
ncbi:MAG: aldo/keto reductase [Nanoarchaeota archaeon]|nr:aldo/keto reductase [DPANN group archaeon]MBL7116943.1 aldo/keto reductase [Nanoarchaeota archaeon]